MVGFETLREPIAMDSLSAPEQAEARPKIVPRTSRAWACLAAANRDRKGCSDGVIVERANKSNRVSLLLAFEMLEPGAVKVARRVLRGAGAGNGPVPTRLRGTQQ